MTDTLVYIVNSAAWSAGGLIIGWLLGRGARDVHDIKEATVGDEHGKQSRRRRGKVDGFNVVVVLLMGVAAIITGVAAHESDEANDRLDRTVNCLLDSFEDQTRALNERTTFSDDAAKAERDYLEAYQGLLAKVADPDAPIADQIVALEKAQSATRERLRLIDKTKQQRTAYPYPEAADVRACAEGD